jgi:uncharacterized membrane protein YobD (UPF0266 family)
MVVFISTISLWSGSIDTYLLCANAFPVKQLIIPIVVMGLIVLSGVGLELAGNNSSYREITVINQYEPVDLSDYNILSTQKEGKRTVIRMDTSVSDKQTLESLFVTYQGRADGFFMTWDFFSYF